MPVGVPTGQRSGRVSNGDGASIVFGRMERLRRRLWIRRQQARGWYTDRAQSDRRAIFVGGCGRSGTTVFKEMLQRHPEVACGPESSLFGLRFYPAYISNRWPISFAEVDAWARRTESVVQFADEFLSDYASKQGKRLWADKTPNNVRATGRILHAFPNGWFIHVLRDARDTVCSLRHHPKERIVNGRVLPVRTDRPIRACARRWRDDVSAGLAYRGHPRYLEIRYEDLVGDPAGQLRRVCAFLGLDYDDRLTRATNDTGERRADVLNNEAATKPLTSTSIGRWERDLSAGERRDVAEVCGELLCAAGYAGDTAWARA